MSELVKLSFKKPKQLQIQIDDSVYTVLKSDSAILERSISIQEQYSKIDTKNARAVYDATKEILSYLNDILGVEAIRDIFPNGEITLADGILLMAEINEKVSKGYNGNIKDKYNISDNE